jgi:hypothetical protein
MAKRNHTTQKQKKRRTTHKRHLRMGGGGMIWEGIQFGLKGVDFFIHLII